MATGVDSSIKVKKETTWGGTFPTTGMYEIPFASEGFRIEKERGFSNNISAGASYSTIYTLGTKAPGALTGDALYTRMDHMIMGVMGTVVTVAGTGAEVGAFSNTYTPNAGTLPSFAVEAKKGNIPTGKVFQFVGMKVSKLEVSWTDRGALAFASDWVGKDESSTNPGGSNPATSDVVLVKDPILMGAQFTTSDIGTGASGTYCIKAGRITIDRKLPSDDYCANTATPAEPNPDGFMEVTGEFTIDFIDRLVYNDFLAQSDLTSDIKFTSPTLGVVGGAVFKSLQFKINKMRYDSPGGLVLVDTPGKLRARVPWTAYGTSGSGSTAEPLSIITYNEVKADTLL